MKKLIIALFIIFAAFSSYSKIEVKPNSEISLNTFLIDSAPSGVYFINFDFSISTNFKVFNLELFGNFQALFNLRNNFENQYVGYNYAIGSKLDFGGWFFKIQYTKGFNFSHMELENPVFYRTEKTILTIGFKL